MRPLLTKALTSRKQQNTITIFLKWDNSMQLYLYLEAASSIKLHTDNIDVVCHVNFGVWACH
jgi:hypothetical protein